MTLLALSNPLVDLNTVSEVYALYVFFNKEDKPDAELILIDPIHAYPVQERIELLKKKSETTVALYGVKRNAVLKTIYVMQSDPIK